MKKKIDLDLLKIIVSALLLGFGLLMHSYFVLCFVLFLISYLVVGYEVYYKAFQNIRKKEFFDENFLMILATIGAFLIQEYPEAVAVMLFYQLGEYIGDRASDRSKDKIIALMDLRSDYANLVTGKSFQKVDPKDVEIGDKIIVRPGERVPLDGKIVEGEGTIDTVMLTGEVFPQKVEIGREVLSGSICLNQPLTIEVIRKMQESTVSKILNLVENAASKKTITEKFITRFARIYTPIVVVISVLILLIPTVFLHLSFEVWFYRALIFLVVSCPCALVISVPLGFFCGIGASSNMGILIKGSDSLEKLSKLGTIAFDKTGTLTKGSFEVSEINAEKGFSQEEILQYAAYAEYYSTHPIALSIQNAYQNEIEVKAIKNHQELSGFGVSIKFQNKKICVGNEKWMRKNRIHPKAVKEGKTIIHISVDKDYAGYFVIADILKEDSKDAIEQLQSRGIMTMILSGDQTSSVAEISEKVGIDQYYASLLPQDKVEKIEDLLKHRDKEHLIAFVGDGINDAPVLMLSDIGISMGGLGSDAAIEASDVVIMNDQLTKINTAIQVANKTKRIILENIVFAISVKIVVMFLGAFGITSIWMAVFADVGVTVLAILNALRIMFIFRKKEKRN